MSQAVKIGRAELVRLLPRRTDRALFVGQTGSGKTTLARALLQERPFTVVLDLKGLIAWPRYKIITKLTCLGGDLPNRIIFRPSPYDVDLSLLESFFRWIYDRRHTTLYVDEAYAVVQHGVPPSYLACMTRGRERGVAVWNAVQRPAWVPLNILSEAEHVYCFRLLLPEDRKRIYAVSGIPIEAQAELQKTEFIYAREGTVFPKSRLLLR